jgi:hypothetical protein
VLWEKFADTQTCCPQKHSCLGATAGQAGKGRSPETPLLQELVIKLTDRLGPVSFYCQRGKVKSLAKFDTLINVDFSIFLSVTLDSVR